MTDIAATGTQGIPGDLQSLAYCGRHRAEPHPDWVSAHPDRLDAHDHAEEPFTREGLVPVAELTTGEPS